MSYMELMELGSSPVIAIHCHPTTATDASAFCPTCGSQLEDSRFQLVCRFCGDYVSSTD